MNSDDAKKINAMMIIEVIGKPKEHLVETLNGMIESIGKETGVKIICKDVKEPVELKERNDFFTTFAEIEIETEQILHLARLMFKYMPAHVDILYPEKITIKNVNWNEVFNEILRKLHGYDEVARILDIEKKILENKLRELTPKQEEKNENSDGKKEVVEEKEVKKRGRKRKVAEE